MDLLAELEQFEKALDQGEDPLQLMMEAMLSDNTDPAPVSTVDCDSNSPDFLQDIVPEDLSVETRGPVPADVEFDANIADSFLTMLGDTDNLLSVSEEDLDAITPDSLLENLDALLTETTGHIVAIDDFCDHSRTESLREIVEFLLGETAEPIPVAQDPQFDPHSFPSPPTLYTVHAEPVFDPQLYKDVPLVAYPPFAQENLVPIGMLNGEVVYALPPQAFSPAFFPTAPPLNTSTSRKRRMSNRNDDSGQSYIKKPPNAFMVYRQEQRCKVITELNTRDCAVVNRELGRRWTALPEQEKDQYYEEADRQRRCHAQLYPEWSHSDNYGKRQKRIRRKSATPRAPS